VIGVSVLAQQMEGVLDVSLCLVSGLIGLCVTDEFQSCLIWPGLEAIPGTAVHSHDTALTPCTHRQTDISTNLHVAVMPGTPHQHQIRVLCVPEVDVLSQVYVCRWIWCSKATRAEVGRLHHLGQHSLKATCRIHRECVCAISIPTAGTSRATSPGFVATFQSLEPDLVRWLDAGQHQTEAQHFAAGVALKSGKYRMQLRQSTQSAGIVV
jgi:hypothetical protein